MTRRFLPFLLVAAVLAGPSAAHADDGWRWPLARRDVHTGFEAPAHRYAPGHRGIDLPARVGEAVVAVADGRVAHAGPVAGVEVVSIQHRGVRSTYQPVRPLVRRGQEVTAGEVIGHIVRAGSHCPPHACLHLGARIGADYADPLELLSAGGRVRLIDPYGPPPQAIPVTSGAIPVSGPITSGFGWRIHPIHGVRRFHDGIDYGAPCGSPVRATAAGRVIRASWAGGYGRRVEIAHGGARVTSYSHLSVISARPGARVRRGSVVGRVGTTGLSTGCHLHYSLHVRGRAVNPR